MARHDKKGIAHPYVKYYKDRNFFTLLINASSTGTFTTRKQQDRFPPSSPLGVIIVSALMRVEEFEAET